MLINWFTVAAQVVNFLILVWLMRRFLYRPILSAIDARATQVAGVLAEADKKMSGATEQLDVYQKRLKDFDEDRSRREAEVDEALKTQRAQMVKSITDDANAARQTQADELRGHQAEFAAQLGRFIEKEVFDISRQSMTDLADANLEHQIVGMFMRRLTTLEARAHASFSDALKVLPSTALVTTSFAVSEGDRALLGNAVNQLGGANVALTFDTSPANICGIELSCAGQRAAWSMTDYMNGLSDKSASLLKDNFPEQTPVAQQPAKAPPAPPAPEVEHDAKAQQPAEVAT